MPAIASPSTEEIMGGFTVGIDIAVLYVPTASYLRFSWLTHDIPVSSLYGILTAQEYFYWWTSQDDSRLLRTLVASVYVYDWYELNHNASVTFHFLILIMASVIATGSVLWKSQTWADFKASRASLITATCGFGFTVILDALIAFSQVYYLWISRTGYQATDHLIRTLMTYIINTGALTICVSIATIVTFWSLALKHSLIFGGLYTVQSKLYANSLIAVLDARQHHKPERKQPSSFVDIELRGGRGSSRPENIEIFRDIIEITDHTLDKNSSTEKDYMVSA
ncbi:uncharacterized protein FIBRA_09089 [Fibroporia radiculosa]|uniref:DUF6534 domain-containing protein n=1 Tax=Fibroporia radiculosa TaxID=599839 RepID=J4H5I3_9APHY|nr:uncharacterized protein FIBRA_09089 [Fibroporia radiculosa]CCM06789.1 predicted protein [Fibroporia radiculosa]